MAEKTKTPPKDKVSGESKGKNPEIKDPVKIDFEPVLDAEGKIGLGEESDPVIDQYLAEVMSVASRMKRKHQMRRYKTRMQIARKRSMKRRANTSKISTRARRSALSNVKRRLAGGRSASQMTYSERARVEKLAKRRASAVNRQARRLIVKKRALERRRLSGSGRR